MANLKRQTAETVWIEVRLPRSSLDELGVLYGGRNRALGAMREGLPDFVMLLLERAPPSGWAQHNAQIEHGR